MEFMNRDFNAAISIRRYAVLETGPEELGVQILLDIPSRSKRTVRS